jgi:molybdopterin synthase sulfur carrier subunit
MIKVRYFARLREQLDSAGEELELTPDLTDLAALTDFLCRRGGPWKASLGPGQTILTALNQEMAHPHTPIRDGDEIAYFPPVTGG